jgi:SAM-dependent methyltransferase
MKTPRLLSTAQLEMSDVVANNRMNRERVLWGVNSYQKELGIDFLSFLRSQAEQHGAVRWMDLCCGTGNALIQAAEIIHSEPSSAAFHLEGLDLVGMFSPVPSHLQGRLNLVVGSVFEWAPAENYDLITCVHGLHYLGDKWGCLRKALGLLKADGQLVVNLDTKNFKDADGKPLDGWWKAQCKQNGWNYNPRRHLLQVVGGQEWPQAWEFLGSDDQAGPNYSGQPVVDSYYRIH